MANTTDCNYEIASESDVNSQISEIKERYERKFNELPSETGWRTEGLYDRYDEENKRSYSMEFQIKVLQSHLKKGSTSSNL